MNYTRSRSVPAPLDAAAPAPASTTEPGVDHHSGHRLVLALACGATFLGFLDIAVVNLAMSAISTQFPGSGPTVTWVVSGYAITFAAWLASAGRLADALGHKPVLLAGVLGFAVTSGVCAVAPTIGVLIAARACQGLAGALLLPAALGALLAATPPARRAASVGAWSASGALATAIGPAVGALVVDAWGWRAIFVMNIPVCAALVIATATLPRTGAARHGLPDVVGAVALTAGVGAIVAVATEGRAWNPLAAWTVAGFGLIAVAVVLWRSAGHPRPALEVRLWRQPEFAAATIVSFVLGAGMFNFLLWSPLLLTGVWGLSLLSAAGCVGAAGLVGAVAAAITGRFTCPGNARWVCAGAMVSMAMGHAVLSSPLFGSSRSWLAWALVAVFLGAGMRIGITALSVVTANAAGPERFSSAVALNIGSRQLGGAIGVSVLTGLCASSDFLPGFHQLFAIMTAATLLAAVVAATWMSPRSPYGPSAITRKDAP
ncbi:MFS transporter [Nocardia sp. XZ_19_369]|uniref:MFS transporter n=1 Tax=Nocardia sp. XZ_19_369 TaxID=2769487 RepID=UPI0018903FA5|nr:MFS transporter [Nocardia sp. XZ_19_369]